MSKSSPLFEDAVRKLNWGRHRAGKFNWLIREHDKANPLKKKRIDKTIIFEREKSYPPELALALGDAIHNLRTSLDLLASNLVELNGMSPKGVYFPFALDAAGLKQQIKDKKFDRAGPKAVQLLHKIGPHHEGNKELRGLHDLDIMDKHKLILPVLHGFYASNVVLNGPSGKLVAEVSGPGDGFSITAGPDDDVTIDSMTFIVVFGKDAPRIFAEKPITVTLDELAANVENVIEAFRKL